MPKTYFPNIDSSLSAKVEMRNVAILFAALLLVACGEDWSCKVDGNSMYSISTSGKIGGAGKGCTCEQIRSFELRTFGRVDEDALKNDFGC